MHARLQINKASCGAAQHEAGFQEIHSRGQNWYYVD